MKIPQGHRKRLITGVIILVVLGLALFMGGWPLFVVLLLASLLAQQEFYEMFWPGNTNMLPEKIAGLLAGGGMITAVFLEARAVMMLCIAAAAVIGAVSFLVRFGCSRAEADETEADLGNSMLVLAGFAYVPLLLQITLYLTPLEILLIIIAVSSSDASAYYAGSAWGKKKIWPRVSPKKSVVGCLASIVVCSLVVSLFGLLVWDGVWLNWLLAGAVINIMAQLGDFFESALKRSRNVKDSGSILPGHGGVLDRIDSFLFALPTYVLLKILIL
ncbi:MAG: phosphatidate cytidylyltransferase [Desulfovibrionaceae bacterium]|nr:phosphatidate cytidylyltransferase [Desulfovibrionaceae bacterium]